MRHFSLLKVHPICHHFDSMIYYFLLVPFIRIQNLQGTIFLCHWLYCLPFDILYGCQGGIIFLLLAHMMQFAQLCQRRPEFLAFEGHKGHKAEKGRKGQKNKYGSKSLELPNSARNAKRAKNCQKEPKASIILNLAFKGPKLKI